MPLTENASRTVFEARRQIIDILNGADDRLVVVVGPCSIHDPIAAREYAGLLREAGMRVVEIVPLVRTISPRSYTWQWPKSFIEINVARLQELGRITDELAADILRDGVRQHQGFIHAHHLLAEIQPFCIHVEHDHPRAG